MKHSSLFFRGMLKKLSLIAGLFLILSTLTPSTPAFATPWSQEQGYFRKVKGKFLFGLKNTLLGWGPIFTESFEPEYNTPPHKPWEGFCVGIARAIIYTANGMVHLVTFPIPIDIPDVGEGESFTRPVRPAPVAPNVS